MLISNSTLKAMQWKLTYEVLPVLLEMELHTTVINFNVQSRKPVMWQVLKHAFL
jgi:hypothetical protein